jgi:hypothetical protein
MRSQFSQKEQRFLNQLLSIFDLMLLDDFGRIGSLTNPLPRKKTKIVYEYLTCPILVTFIGD